jgi:hypothetical protein
MIYKWQASNDGSVALFIQRRINSDTAWRDRIRKVWQGILEPKYPQRLHPVIFALECGLCDLVFS